MSIRHTFLRTRGRWLLAGLFALAVLGIGGLGYAAREETRSVPSPDASQLLTLREKALAFAAANGELNPTNIAVVGATRQAAVERLMSGATVDSDQAMFVVVMDGNFVGNTFSTPPRHPEPRTGAHLIVFYDAETLEQWDTGLIYDRRPPLELFGTPIRLNG